MLEREKEKICTDLWWGKLKERENLEDQNLDLRIVLKWTLWESGVRI